MSSSSGIFEACLDLHAEGGTMDTLSCVSANLEHAQGSTMKYTKTWLMILCGSLVFFMQAGFAMLCAGSVRKKNTQNTMLKNLLDACGAALAFFSVGYGFAYGGDNDEVQSAGTTFIGMSNFMATGTIDLAFYFFQYTFVATCVTIVAGTLAERCQMTAYLCYSFFLSGFVYPVVAHAVWSSTGFLSNANGNPLLGIGMIDFAGGGVIHLTGGLTALYAAYILGSRRGRFYDITTGAPLAVPQPMPGHSVSLQIFRAFILLFGWFGFNPGSALLLGDTPYQAEIGALSAVNTFLASAAGCISALALRAILVYQKTGDLVLDLAASMNGCLSGLVAITAGCGTMETWAAAITGAIGGVLYLLGSDYLIKFKIDDAVDAIPVHLINGVWGVIAVGLFASPLRMGQAYGVEQHPGLIYLGQNGADAHLLACQLIGILCIFGWTLVTMLPFFMWLNFMGWFRSDSVQELVGLDISYGADALQPKQTEKEEEIREEYMHAYQRYKKAQKTTQSSTKRRGDSNTTKQSVDDNDDDTRTAEPTIEVPLRSA